jgi:2-keto-4-pentenoate hydratase
MTAESTSADVPLDAIADELIGAEQRAGLIAPISERHPGFDLPAAYEVLARIAARRRSHGWTLVGRKIGFTNSTIWALYGVDAPMWAHTWDRTVHGPSAEHRLSLARLVQPRLEPEVVFRLGGPVPPTDDPAEVLQAVDAIAAGFELVQCHYPDWRFTLPDCTAAFGLHGALVVGPWVEVTDRTRSELAERLTSFTAVLTRDGAEIDRGNGANVLGSPAAALAHLARVVASQRPTFDGLHAGEVITTGTLTDAQPVAAGQTWSCDYGDLGLPPVSLTLDG